jgi:hypothetical protein
MTANTKEDSELKVGLVDDTMTIINIEGMYPSLYSDSRETKRSSGAST